MDYVLQPEDREILDFVTRHKVKPGSHPDKLYELAHRDFPTKSEDWKDTLVVSAITWVVGAAIAKPNYGTIH